VAWIERQWRRAENGEGLSLAIAKAGKDEAVAAIVLLSRPTPGSAAIGYWIIQRERGQGYASHAVRLLSAWALTAAGFAQVEVLVEPGNAASQGVLERAAFRREGHTPTATTAEIARSVDDVAESVQVQNEIWNRDLEDGLRGRPTLPGPS
jgi:RimJ/RimL family protein N-acetyltransferase